MYRSPWSLRVPIGLWNWSYDTFVIERETTLNSPVLLVVVGITHNSLCHVLAEILQ